MPFTIDYCDGDAYEWGVTSDGATRHHNPAYTPTLYAATPPKTTDREALLDLRRSLETLPQVVATSLVSKRPGFRYGAQLTLRIDVTDIDAVDEVAWNVARRDRPGTYRLYNVDFSREFRYCLEHDCSPRPNRSLRTLSIAIPRDELGDGEFTTLMIDGVSYDGSVSELLDDLQTHLCQTDPDVLVINRAAVVPTLFGAATRHDLSFELGRRPGYQRLASRSTYESYGQVGHSPARYNVPGRVLIDESNTFFWTETTLAGCLDLVERSGKPLQELGWASIGNVLTAIQIQEALARDVLVPWNAWRPERPKTMRQLHAADRGGFTFTPAVGLHQDVHELDFASLYPSIICTHNLSPDTVRCDCHADRVDLDELGYAVCDEPGYLPEVLQPIIDDRAAYKRQLEQTGDPDDQAALEGQASALKWILVSCFGYQGFSNAKFGRIEVHEAINAIARDLLLDAKATFEAGGWRLLHGIVDSLWVTPAPDAEQQPLSELAATITEQAGIDLEYEASYEWLALVPQRSSGTGALTKYFGKRRTSEQEPSDADDLFKFRGIECRQRSTPPFVATVQQDLVATLDDALQSRPPANWSGTAPEAVCDRLQVHLARLHRGAVDPEQLAITQRTSQPREEYRHATRAVAALDRATDTGRSVHPGQSVEYVVVDDDRQDRDRVQLLSEVDAGAYDTGFYAQQTIRAAESVLAPLGWDEPAIRAYLVEQRDTTLEAF